MNTKTFYIIIIFCVVAIIGGSVISLNPDLEILHNTSNSVLGAGIIGIIVILVLRWLNLLKID